METNNENILKPNDTLYIRNALDFNLYIVNKKDLIEDFNKLFIQGDNEIKDQTVLNMLANPTILKIITVNDMVENKFEAIGTPVEINELTIDDISDFFEKIAVMVDELNTSKPIVEEEIQEEKDDKYVEARTYVEGAFNNTANSIVNILTMVYANCYDLDEVLDVLSPDTECKDIYIKKLYTKYSELNNLKYSNVGENPDEVYKEILNGSTYFPNLAYFYTNIKDTKGKKVYSLKNAGGMFKEYILDQFTKLYMLKPSFFNDEDTIDMNLAKLQSAYTNVIYFTENKNNNYYLHIYMDGNKYLKEDEVKTLFRALNPSIFENKNGKNTASPYKSIIKIIGDKERFEKKVKFAYEALQHKFKVLAEDPKLFENEGIPIGINQKDNSIIKYKTSLEQFDTTILAESRQGKGVLTLSILASYIGMGARFYYFDCKPDMSTMLQKLEVKYGVPIFTFDALQEFSANNAVKGAEAKETFVLEDNGEDDSGEIDTEETNQINLNKGAMHRLDIRNSKVNNEVFRKNNIFECGEYDKEESLFLMKHSQAIYYLKFLSITVAIEGYKMANQGNAETPEAEQKDIFIFDEINTANRLINSFIADLNDKIKGKKEEEIPKLYKRLRDFVLYISSGLSQHTESSGGKTQTEYIYIGQTLKRLVIEGSAKPKTLTLGTAKELAFLSPSVESPIGIFGVSKYNHNKDAGYKINLENRHFTIWGSNYTKEDGIDFKGLLTLNDDDITQDWWRGPKENLGINYADEEVAKEELERAYGADIDDNLALSKTSKVHKGTGFEGLAQMYCVRPDGTFDEERFKNNLSQSTIFADGVYAKMGRYQRVIDYIYDFSLDAFKPMSIATGANKSQFKDNYDMLEEKKQAHSSMDGGVFDPNAVNPDNCDVDGLIIDTTDSSNGMHNANNPNCCIHDWQQICNKIKEYGDIEKLYILEERIKAVTNSGIKVLETGEISIPNSVDFNVLTKTHQAIKALYLDKITYEIAKEEANEQGMDFAYEYLFKLNSSNISKVYFVQGGKETLINNEISEREALKKAQGAANMKLGIENYNREKEKTDNWQSSFGKAQGKNDLFLMKIAQNCSENLLKQYDKMTFVGFLKGTLWGGLATIYWGLANIFGGAINIKNAAINGVREASTNSKNNTTNYTTNDSNEALNKALQRVDEKRQEKKAQKELKKIKNKEKIIEKRDKALNDIKSVAKNKVVETFNGVKTLVRKDYDVANESEWFVEQLHNIKNRIDAFDFSQCGVARIDLEGYEEEIYNIIKNESTFLGKEITLDNETIDNAIFEITTKIGFKQNK